MIVLQRKVNALEALGKYFLNIIEQPESPSSLEAAVFIKKAEMYNPWFTEAFTLHALKAWSFALQRAAVESWVNHYNFENKSFTKTLALIPAGNIPLVSLHDILCAYICDWGILVKPSSDDPILTRWVLDILSELDPDYAPKIKFAERKLVDFDAIIATGSNNSARYFEFYFGKYPHIIRKNRNSVAIVSGNESELDLLHLGQDIFTYFGLGCRNVSKLYLPKNYDLDVFFKGIFPFKGIVDHNKYANNYDYHRAIYLMNSDTFLENGFLILKENAGIGSPVGVLFYEYYDDLQILNKNLEGIKDQIQCRVSLLDGDIPLGQSQFPSLLDYADDVDVVKFLLAQG